MLISIDSASQEDVAPESSFIPNSNEAEPTNHFETNLQDMNWIWDMEMPFLSDT